MTALQPPERPLDVSAVAIDLDGTLLDTVHDLAAAVNGLLVDLGYAALPAERIRTFVGKGMANLVRLALAEARKETPQAIGEEEVLRALAGYQARYDALLGRHTTIYDGVREGLIRLSAMQLPLAVITNKASRFVRPHLKQADIEQYFDLVMGAEDHPTRKPDPGPLLHVAKTFRVPPARLLMIGDSVNDAEAARAAGCPVLIVPYGYNEGAPVQSLDVDGIVSSLAAAAEWVRPVLLSR